VTLAGVGSTALLGSFFFQLLNKLGALFIFRERGKVGNSTFSFVQGSDLGDCRSIGFVQFSVSAIVPQLPPTANVILSGDFDLITEAIALGIAVSAFGHALGCLGLSDYDAAFKAQPTVITGGHDLVSA
jgi:hypothetical protein